MRPGPSTRRLPARLERHRTGRRCKALAQGCRRKSLGNETGESETWDLSKGWNVRLVARFKQIQSTCGRRQAQAAIWMQLVRFRERIPMERSLPGQVWSAARAK